MPLGSAAPWEGATGGSGSQETYLRPKATNPSRKGRLARMKLRYWTLGALTAAVVAAAPAVAAPAPVNPRVEGAASTNFHPPGTTAGPANEQEKARAPPPAGAKNS